MTWFLGVPVLLLPVIGAVRAMAGNRGAGYYRADGSRFSYDREPPLGTAPTKRPGA